MYTANIISKYILFWTSFRSDSNYSCQSNTMQRETVTTTTTTKMCLKRIKGSLGTNHCDAEPKHIVSGIHMVQDSIEHLYQSSVHNNHEN